MFRRPLAACAIVMSLGVAGPVHAAANPKVVAEAERAFAADGASMGIKQSFLKHMADDAIVFAPDAVNAKAYYGAKTGESEPKLVWWPAHAAIARSGDLGFTTGPYELDGKRGGHYFTVWAKQADGSWKWLFDGGVENDASRSSTNGDVDYFPTNSVPTVSGDQYRPALMAKFANQGAMSDLEGAEIEIASLAREDILQAYEDRLATDAIVMGSPAAPAMDEASRTAELKTRPQRINFSKLGGGVSKAGDFGWTYGDASWSKAGAKHRAHYVRVWQKRYDGWRIIFDELLPAPDAAPTQ
jgi:ketosteroid isomerase-like protein